MGLRSTPAAGTGAIDFHVDDAPARRRPSTSTSASRAGRHPLRLAGEAGDVRDDEPRRATGLLRMNVHAALDLDRERPRPVGCDGAARSERDARMSETEDRRCPTDPRAYLAQVMAEIDEEVRRRRASGDLPPRLERELDELFLEHSPVAGRGGGLDEALRMVDAAAFIDPVVPVASERAAGAVVKKGMRTLNLWYVGWVTHQVSQFAAAVSRALHLLDDRLAELRAPGGGPAGPGRRRGRGAAACTAPTPGGSSPRWRRWPGPGRVLHAAAATGGWCASSWRQASTPTASTPARGWSTGPSSAADLRGEGAGGAPAGGRAGRPGRRRAQRRGGRDGRRRAEPAARGRRRPAGPRRDPRRPLPLPAAWVVAGRAARGRPGPGAAAAARHLAPPARAARLRGRRHRGAGRGRLPGDGRPRRLTSPYAPTGGERRRRGAGGRAPVRPRPDPARRHREPHPPAAPGAARRRLALGDLRRGHPRRPGRPRPHTGCTPSTPPPATSPSTSSRPPRRWPASWPSARAPGARLPQRHRTRALRRLGARSVRGRPRRPTSWRCWPRAARSGWPTAPTTRSDLRRAGCRRTAVVPVLVDYRRVGRRPTRGWRPSWPGRRGRRRRLAVRRAGGALQGPARPGQGALGLPPPLRPAARLHLVGGTSGR